MRISTTGETPADRGNPDWFTGTVWREAAPAGPSPDASISRVCFEPEARTHWHTHPEGQILHVITGTGRAATEGGPVTQLNAGDVVYFAPDEKHWHGAAPGSFMVHLAINPATTSDGGTDWLEPVTDGQYEGVDPANSRASG